jgi:predicted component of type VI protein secretion system
MNTKTAILLTFATSIALTGCSHVNYKNAKILSQDDAKVAVTINKDLSNTVINTNTGERIEPCKIDPQEVKLSEEEIIKRCYPDGHDPDGKILSEMKITVREGSKCITIVSASRYYVFCQPPLNLGF